MSTTAHQRRNLALVTDKGSAVRNRQSWTVTAVGRDGTLEVTDSERVSGLPTSYVARHVELGWAVTGSDVVVLIRGFR